VTAIACSGQESQRQLALPEHTIVVGIATDTDVLRHRIDGRAEEIFSSGVIDETTRVRNRFGLNHEATTGNIYPLIDKYLRGAVEYEEMKQRFVFKDRQLAKRQMTWFRRNPHIMWCTLEAANHYLEQALSP
jgi:tRNA dimethylallyltransferase